MKKVYYVCKCGSGLTVHEDLLELVRDEGNVMVFRINTFDWDSGKVRNITLKALKVVKTDYDGSKMNCLNLKSSKQQFEGSFIRMYEIDDNEEPEKHRIIH